MCFMIVKKNLRAKMDKEVITFKTEFENLYNFLQKLE